MKVKLNIFKLMKTKTRKKKLIRKYKTIITLLGSHLTQRSWTKKKHSVVSHPEGVFVHVHKLEFAEICSCTSI